MKILAKDHEGMTCAGLRYLEQNGPCFTEMRRMMAGHLRELAERYYKGDITVVDEFLQLYRIGEADRKAAKATHPLPV